MIVPMKKLHVVVQKKDIVSALESLRELGSVHVEHQEPLTGYQLEERREEVEILESAIDILTANKTEDPASQKEVSDWTEVVNAVLELSAKVGHCEESIVKRQAQINQWEPWGDFDSGEIEGLEAVGIYMQLCAVPKSKRNDIPKGVILETVYSSSGVDRCVAISREKINLPFEKIALPPMGLKQMNVLQVQEQEKSEQAIKGIAENHCYLESLKETLVQRRDVLHFEEVERGMREEEELAVLKGFCPVDACKAIEKKAKAEHWGILFEDPSEEDQVPTLVRNPKWVNLIKPVFNFIDIAPGYKEYDISLLFLLFFSLFVGMLIGDAGYGMLFVLAVAFAHIKFGKKMTDRTPLYLAYVLSGCVIVWGVLTGTFFGQQWLSQSFVQPVLPWLKNNDNIQLFCFMLGAIHLSIAHVWRTILKFPSPRFLADVGWLALLWSMFSMARMLILGTPLSALSINLLIAGVFLIVFFTRPSKNPLKAIGPGLGDLALNGINAFTDIVSYIRLFAVGLATVAVADATNAMANEYGGVWFFIILLLGHVINVVLALMAILVHGLRLNVLEFSGHLNMEWAGFNYAPFKKIASDNF